MLSRGVGLRGFESHPPHHRYYVVRRLFMLTVIALDENTTISQLKKQVEAFRDERKWTDLDTPRSLAISIVLEAAELLEHFQWDNQTPVLDKVADELADVITYCLGFSIT